MARSDCAVIGTWKDDIQVKDAEVTKYAKNGVDMQAEICDLCPTGCMTWDGKKLNIDDSECVKCMHCINVLPNALAPGKERGAAVLIGAKAPIIGGALLGSVMVPFLEMEPPYEEPQGTQRGDLGLLGRARQEP